ncbi:hypothetical protein MASR2M78_20380 [Treponema sp.]
MVPNKTLRKVSLIALFLATLVFALSCQSPLYSIQKGRPEADLSLLFVVSGRVPQNMQVSVSDFASRLLLPTASSLTVTLTLEGSSSGAPIVNTTPIAAGASLVPVTISQIPLGTYTIRAEAKDSGGTVRFKQTATGISAGAEIKALTLNLVPTDLATLEQLDAYGIEIPALSSGESKTLLVPTSSKLFTTDSLFFIGLESNTQFFIQKTDGSLLAQGTGPARIGTAFISPTADYILTIYSTVAQGAARVCGGPPMVDVPSGAFQRDAIATNISYVDEFSFGRYEVTRELYQAVMGWDPVSSYSTGKDAPVHSVSWYWAIIFCNKLSLLEGLSPAYSVYVAGTPVDFTALNQSTVPLVNDANWNAVTRNGNADGYRLPTETEWAWAAMGANQDRANGYTGIGVNTTGYQKGYAGSLEAGSAYAAAGDYGWISGSSGSASHDAGTKLPNELGIYDMTGNVEEKCWDWYGTHPGGTLVDYQGAASGTNRVEHGGNWNSSPSGFSIGFRNLQDPGPGGQVNGSGFRVARGVRPTFTLTYDANGPNSGTAPSGSGPAYSGGTFTVSANTGNLAGAIIQDGIRQRFTGWNDRADGLGTAYLPGASIPVVGNLILYAQYTSDAGILKKVGPAGGLVFYDKGIYSTADSGPSWRYIEAAPYDQSAGVAWAPADANLISYLWDFGTGYINTQALVALYPGANYAANICDELVLNGFDDWYLPSLYELGGDGPTNSGGMWEKLYYDRPNTIFPNLAGFVELGYYWNSSQANANFASRQTFEGGASNSTGVAKTSLYRVRAARRF